MVSIRMTVYLSDKKDKSIINWIRKFIDSGKYRSDSDLLRKGIESLMENEPYERPE